MTNKVALVTGAGTGIGKAAALKCWANTGSCRFQLRRLPRIPCRNSTSGPDPSTETAMRGAGSTKMVSMLIPPSRRRS